MWQVAGGHGQIEKDSAISDMEQYQKAGFSTWDMADIYGPAEEFLGKFRQKLSDSSKIQALTKFVPNPGPMSRSIVEYSIDQSIQKMQVPSIDLLQFHWWDYSDSSYLDALNQLTKLCQEGKIRHLGLTNFDTKRLQIIVQQGFKIISNQVQHSIIDSRPEKKMIPYCQKQNIKLLTYGTLLGGFFSEKYLKTPEPTREKLYTSSLQKYKNMIDVWGGWILFQELLEILAKIAKKHGCSIANIATRFILDKQSVAAVIIGSRLGISEHISENLQVFEIKLDSEDRNLINSVTSKSNDLFEQIGDCGDEYR